MCWNNFCGLYSVVYGGTLTASGDGAFGSGESTTFGSCPGGALPLELKPDSAPATAFCTSLVQERCETAPVGCLWSAEDGCTLKKPEKN